jgi:probable HAF family extracellular repeat protein
MRRVFFFALLLTSASARAASAATAPLPPVTIVDIGDVGGGSGPSVAYGVANGLVVGYALTAGNNGQPNAVAFTGGALQDLAAGLYGSLAAAVNTNGVAVGQVFLSGQTQQRAAIFSGKRVIDIGTLPGDASSVASGINTSGVVVGTSTPATQKLYVSQAFVYRNGVMQGIPQLRNLTNFLGATAQGINDSGVIVGSVGVKGFLGAATSSYMFDGTNLTLFATIHGYENSVAAAINAKGTVVGYRASFSFSINAPLRAYSYSGGNLVDLGTLYPNDTFSSSVALAINSPGVAVGYSQASQGRLPPQAVAFANGSVGNLNRLLPANSGWTLEVAEGIDDLGNIVGIGLHNGIERGFLLRTGHRFSKS